MNPCNLKLSLEPLEPRRILAALTVTNNSDLVDGDVSSVSALVASPGPDGISLREAIEATNATPGADEITFDFGHDGPETIVLGGSELHISDDLTINGPGAELLAIDGDGESRVLRVDDGDADGQITAEISEISIVGGNASGEIEVEPGGRNGGGVYSLEDLSLVGAVVQDNVAEVFGGGLFIQHPGSLVLHGGSIVGNKANAGGGVANQGTAVIANSLVADNVSDFAGGGIALQGELTLINSSVINNVLLAESDEVRGGGIEVWHYWWYGELHSTNSIIANNVGGDVWAVEPSEDHAHANFYGMNIMAESALYPSSSRSSISITGPNILNVDPMLDENGIPLPGSPAIDAGEASLAVDSEGNPLKWDARGEGYHRVLGSSVDIGAFEAPGFLPGDSTNDGLVALDDFSIVKNNFGEAAQGHLDGDFNGDGMVDLLDFNLLKANFGEQLMQDQALAAAALFAGLEEDEE